MRSNLTILSLKMGFCRKKISEIRDLMYLHWMWGNADPKRGEGFPYQNGGGGENSIFHPIFECMSKKQRKKNHNLNKFPIPSQRDTLAPRLVYEIENWKQFWLLHSLMTCGFSEATKENICRKYPWSDINMTDSSLFQSRVLFSSSFDSSSKYSFQFIWKHDNRGCKFDTCEWLKNVAEEIAPWQKVIVAPNHEEHKFSLK